jgi:cell division protein FtsI (penicillin-binding protein 3)
MAVWALGIGARLCFLQVVESATYVEKAAQHQQQVVKITPRRGDILDRDGNALAVSLQVDSVFARPAEVQDKAATARTLSRLIGVPSNDLLRRLNGDSPWVWIKRKISASERQAIEKAKLAGVGFQKEYRRVYPLREKASHLLGYVDVDGEGRTGLEESYNRPVRGLPGEILLLRDAHGTSYQREQQVSQAGATLTTTIDKAIQYIVEKEVQIVAEKTHASAISVVVMDPHSGAILAMANSPTFNPNEYGKVSSWINPSLSLTYEPGSTFKMVTVAAALEEGLVTPDEVFYCENGSIVVSGRRIRDHKPYGNLTVSEIVQNSSNVGTIKIAQRVGPDKLKSYIDRYGFGERTSVDLPAEVGGLVRDVSKWSKTSIASIAIGQELSVTPLQIASMVSTIANGGIRYKPYVVQKIQDPNGGTLEIKPNGTRVMSQNTAQLLHDMLEDVVTDGTARTSQLEGYRAAGKTGTAQKVDPETRRYSHSKYVASFAGFAPVSNPRLAIVVVVDEPRGLYYGGEVAAPVFKRIAEQVLRLKSVVPDVPLYAPHYAITPNKAKNKPAPRPNKDPFKGPDASLVSSKEGAGFQDGPITVPDVIGQPLLKASDTIDRLGLVSASDGNGKVIWQEPAAGMHVRPGTRVQLRLSLR